MVHETIFLPLLSIHNNPGVKGEGGEGGGGGGDGEGEGGGGSKSPAQVIKLRSH